MLASFLHALFDNGHLTVPRPERLETVEDLHAAEAMLKEYESLWRLDFPGAAPRFEVLTAQWAARLVYRAAQSAVYRDIEEGAMRDGLSQPCPTTNDAAALHYSVDLVLRFLPDLANLAQRASSEDLLVKLLREMAAQWPLSSVGMKGIEVATVDAIVGHAGLVRLYVDRVVARKDFARLRDPRVRNAARSAIGAYAELHPELWKVLESPP